MSIRFRFRSAASYDVVEIGKRESITVRELKAEIIRQKNLNLSHDFNLVISDAVTGQEYDNAEFDIPNGSSVILKRVPAGTTPATVVAVDKVENFTARAPDFVNPVSFQMDEFDDFGADLCPLADATFPGCVLESDKNTKSTGKAYLTPTRPGLQKLEFSDLSQAMAKETGCRHNENVKDLPQRLRVDEEMKLEKFKNQAMRSTDFPLELNCPLCNKFFKNAVMIPCCQHSFCEKCITTVLVEKGKCPKCLSCKCKIDNLLPNLSLRQAIEHFLETQMLNDGSQNEFCKYVPDGESGIQAKEVSCAVTVVQREPELPHSPTATGQGSNQIVSDSFYKSLSKKKTPYGGLGYCTNNFGGREAVNTAEPAKRKQMERERGRYRHHVNAETVLEHVIYLGENQPISLPQPHMQDEAFITFNKKRDALVATGGDGDLCLLPASRQKGSRACYMCGSPDHFIRDCPGASNPYPMLQPGSCLLGGGMASYTSPFWNSTPPFRPYGNMYGNFQMMPYNPSIVPVDPPYVPRYVPATYGGLPGPRGNVLMGSMAPPTGKRVQHQASHPEYVDLQHFEKRMKLSHENPDRGSHLNLEDGFRDHYRSKEPKKSNEYKFHRQRDPSERHPQDSSSGILRKKQQLEKYYDFNSHSIDERREKSQGRDQRLYGLERPTPEIEHKPRSEKSQGRDQRLYALERPNEEIEHKPRSSCRHSEEGHEHLNRSSKKHHERRQSGSQSSHSRHQTQKDRHHNRSFENYHQRRQNNGEYSYRHQTQKYTRKLDPDARGSYHKYNSNTNAVVGESMHADLRWIGKEKDSGCNPRRSRHCGQPQGTTIEWQHDRRQMRSGLDEECKEDYHHHKRKRVY